MNKEIPPPLHVEFKDRKLGLTVFGILTILAGLLCGLMVPFMLAAQSMAAKTPGAQQNPGAMAIAVGLYGGLAVVMVWLGVGSILARRWARALLLIFSWATLITGIIVVACLGAMSGTLLSTMRSAQQQASTPALPDSTNSIILLTVGAFFSVIFVIVPVIWVFFYGSKNVKATCEAHDPRTRWTDRCPLPVLAASLVLTSGGLFMLLTAFSFHGAIPLFGVNFVGVTGNVLHFVFSVLWFYSAWAMYRLDQRGWWLVVILISLATVSGAVTSHQQHMMEFYKQAGYSAKQLAALDQCNFLKGNNALWFTLASTVPWLVYLLFLKRYFRPRAGTVEN